MIQSSLERSDQREDDSRHASQREDPDDERQTPAPMSDRVRALRLEKGKGAVKGPRRRRWWWLVLLLLLVGGGAAAYRHVGGYGMLVVDREVEAVAATSERPLEIVLDTTGYIIAHSVIKVTPRVPGTVVELNIEEGQKVKKDQLLAKLDDRQYRADLDQARAALKVAQAQLDEMKAGARTQDIDKARAAVEQAEAERDLLGKELERAKQLKGTISPAEYDRTDAKHRQAKASAEQAQRAYELVKLGAREERIAALTGDVENAKALVAKADFFYDGTRISAPVTGTVLQRSIELGEMVRPESLANPFCTIADLGALEAEIDIQERDLAEIRQGQPCLVTTDAYPDREYRGRLDWLSPVYNRQRGVRRAKVKILDPDQQLSPDMNCRVQVLKQAPAADGQNVVHVPREAILEDAGQTFAFVFQGETAQRRAVQLGKTSGGKVEVREGIAANELVLLGGDKPLEDGQKVRPHVKRKKEKGK